MLVHRSVWQDVYFPVGSSSSVWNMCVYPKLLFVGIWQEVYVSQGLVYVGWYHDVRVGCDLYSPSSRSSVHMVVLLIFVVDVVVVVAVVVVILRVFAIVG